MHQMIGRILFVTSLIALAIGAAYSYEQVRFGERTASFFKVAFAEEGTTRIGRGGHGFEGRGGRGSGMRRGRPTGEVAGEDHARVEESSSRLERRLPAPDEIGENSSSRDALSGDGDVVRERSGESRGRGGHRSRGASISLEEVGYYLTIFAFATMLTFTIDGLLKHLSRRRFTI